MIGVRSSESRQLDRLQVLVVEDETLVSLLVEDMLEELGCGAVWSAGAIDEARAILEGGRPDVAVLDVNLNGALVYPLAAQLRAASIPFVFATGYGREGIPADWARYPVIQKPFALSALAAALDAALAMRTGEAGYER